MSDEIKPIQLNLGCGIGLKKEYINVDKFYTLDEIKANPQGVIEEGAEYIQADIMHLPFEDNYADVAEMHQVIEHFGMVDTIPLLKECHRVLKPGGLLRISCPSFNGLCCDWIAAQVRATDFDPADYFFHNQEFYGIQTQDGEHHKCAITPKYLAYCLNQAGFHTDVAVLLFPKGGLMDETGYGLMQPVHNGADQRSYFRMETIYSEVQK
jgi:predicted SAM-dependent methyltransferase